MENIKKKMLIYKIILGLLLISAIILAGIILKKQYDDRRYDGENKEIVDLFYEAEKQMTNEKEKETEEDTKEIQLEYKGYRVIGLIQIPAIDLEYPILEHTTQETMRISISRFDGVDVNENGNISLAGHNNYSGTMFGKNHKLVLGDKIYLTDLKGKKIEYEIYEIFSTDPNDTSILETKDENRREVTLITCKNGRSERLIIKAKENIKK